MKDGRGLLLSPRMKVRGKGTQEPSGQLPFVVVHFLQAQWLETRFALLGLLGLIADRKILLFRRKLTLYAHV